MLVEMELKTNWYDKKRFLKEVSKLSDQGWKIKSTCGGKAETYEFHGATLTKDI